MDRSLEEINQKIRDGIFRTKEQESPENIMKKKNNKIQAFISNSEFSIFAVGKASILMVRGLEQETVKKANLKICLAPNPETLGGFTVFKGNHPFPGDDTFNSSEQIFNMIREDRSEKLLFLLSGGSSSLFEKIAPGISRERYEEIMHKLVSGGYPIDQINSVRCMLSDVKCGKMLNHSNYSSLLILAISDVPGDDISVIGSNPFFPKKKIKLDSRLLETFGIEGQKLEYRQCGVDSEIILAGENYSRALLENLDLPFEKISLGNILKEDVNVCSEKIISMLREKYELKKQPFLFSAYGETTSKVIGNGKGGRNCYLSALILEKADESEEFSFISFATDGQDGNSGLAGFLVDTTLKNSISRDELEKYIINSDTGTLAEKTQRNIFTGPTGNNVSDVVIGYYGGTVK